MRLQSEHWRFDDANGVTSTMGPVPNGSEREPHLPLVREIMVSHPTVVSPGTPTGKAAKLMAARRIGCVVVSNNGSAEGIFTERDLLRRAVGSRGWEALKRRAGAETRRRTRPLSWPRALR